MSHFHLEGDYPRVDPPSMKFIKEALLHQLRDVGDIRTIDLDELRYSVLDELRYSVLALSPRKWVDDIRVFSAFLSHSPKEALNSLKLRVKGSYPPTTYYFFFMYLLPTQKYLILEFSSQREPTGSEIFSDSDDLEYLV